MSTYPRFETDDASGELRIWLGPKSTDGIYVVPRDIAERLRENERLRAAFETMAGKLKGLDSDASILWNDLHDAMKGDTK